MSESPSSQQHPGAEAEAAAAEPYSMAYVRVPGVRFVPSDQELIIDYLWRKLRGKKPPTDLVHEADVYEEHPKDLTSRLGRSVEGFWYVLSKRSRKYAKGNRPSRSTGTAGRWKAVGKNVPVLLGADDGKDKDADGNPKPVLGHKCALAYELFVRDDDDQSQGSSRPRTEKTEWKMCEFVAEDTNRAISTAPDKMLLNDWVLCRITRKAAAGKVAVEEDHGQATLVDEPDEDEQLQSAPPPPHLDPSSQQARAMPNMPHVLLPHEDTDGSDGTEVETEGVDADLELPGDDDGAATDVNFVEWSVYHHLELWGNGGAGNEFSVAFDHEWNVDGNRFGPTADPDPLVNRFEVPADPDSGVCPIELPSGPQTWDVASRILFSDDSHAIVKDEIFKAIDDAGKESTTSRSKTSAPTTASADSEE